MLFYAEADDNTLRVPASGYLKSDTKSQLIFRGMLPVFTPPVTMNIWCADPQGGAFEPCENIFPGRQSTPSGAPTDELASGSRGIRYPLPSVPIPARGYRPADRESPSRRWRAVRDAERVLRRRGHTSRRDSEPGECDRGGARSRQHLRLVRHLLPVGLDQSVAGHSLRECRIPASRERLAGESWRSRALGSPSCRR